MFEANIYANRLRVDNRENDILTSGSVNVSKIHLAFSEEWTGLTKTIIFKTNSAVLPIILKGDELDYTMDIPWEVLTVPGETITLGAYGVRNDDPETEEDEKVVLPTVWGSFPEKIKTGVGVTNPIPPSPTYNAYLALLDLVQKALAGGGGGGTTEHNKLSNRELADQHPMSAISGLIDKFTQTDRTIDQAIAFIQSVASMLAGQSVLFATIDETDLPKANDVKTYSRSEFVGIMPVVSEEVSVGFLITDSKLYLAKYTVTDVQGIDITISFVSDPSLIGPTYTPFVSEEGEISWTNDGGLENPQPVNIKGPAGANGVDYLVFNSFLESAPELNGTYDIQESDFNRTPIDGEWCSGVVFYSGVTYYIYAKVIWNSVREVWYISVSKVSRLTGYNGDAGIGIPVYKDLTITNAYQSGELIPPPSYNNPYVIFSNVRVETPDTHIGNTYTGVYMIAQHSYDDDTVENTNAFFVRSLNQSETVYVFSTSAEGRPFVKAKTIQFAYSKEVIDNEINNVIREKTQAEYDALTDEEKKGAIVITDAEPSSGGSGLTVEESMVEDAASGGQWFIRKYSDGYCEMQYIKSKIYSDTDWITTGSMVCIDYANYSGSVSLPFVLVGHINTSWSVITKATSGHYGCWCGQGGLIGGETEFSHIPCCTLFRPTKPSTGPRTYRMICTVIGRWK